MSNKLVQKLKNLTKLKKDRRILIFFLGFLVVLIPVAYFVFTNPISTEAAWYLSDSLHRKQLNLVNNSGESLASDIPIAVTVNTKALFDLGKLQSDCDDLRVVYQSGSTNTELSRYISYPGGGTCATSEAAKITFPLQVTLSDDATSSSYYMYYGDNSASAPSNQDNAFDIGNNEALFICPFDGTTTCVNGNGTEEPTTATGAIRYSGSKSALSFNGLPGFNNHVNVGTPASLDNLPQNDFTFELWVKYFPIDNGNGNYTIGGNYSGASDGFRLNINDVGAIDAEAWFSTTNARSSTNNGTISANTWTHLAFGFSAATKEWTIYVNGQEASYTIQTPGSGTYVGDSGNLLIGVAPDSAWTFPGLMDEIRISNILRYSTSFTTQTTPFIRDENTKLLYHFDENGDDPRKTGLAVDDSGNENDGTITGAKYVAGLVGVNNGTTNTGKADGGNTYAGHEGIFIEEGTTNKITNPSFEHATYNTNWDAVGANLTASENTTAPYYKFGSKSLKLIASASAIDGSSNMDTIGIDPNSTATHILSFYAYDTTSGNVGGTITSSIIKPVWGGTAQNGGTYTDMGGGWWRVSYSTTTTDSINEYGVEVQVSKTIYLDGVQLEEKSYATTYADGSLTSSAGGANTYFWDDNCDGTLDTGEDETADQNTQCSSRIGSNVQYTTTSNFNTNTGTLTFWHKRNTVKSSDKLEEIFSTGNSNDFIIVYYYSPTDLRAQIDIDGVSKACGDSLTSDDPGEWHMFTLIWALNTPGSDRCQVYHDGSVSGTGSSDQTWGTFSTPSYLGIGIDPGDGSNDGGKSVSNLRIYNSTLTSTEITDLYYSGLVSHSDNPAVDRFGKTNEDPVAIYHFDEGYGTTAHDSSINSNDLLLDEASFNNLSGNYPAQLTRTLKFDGSDDSAYSTTPLSGFNFGKESFTVSAWFRHPSSFSGTADTIISQYQDKGYKIYMNSSGFICGAIDDDASWDPEDFVCSTTSYADSAWHHLEFVKDSTSSIKLYIDTNEIGSDVSLTSNGNMSGGAPLVLGADNNNTNYWDGFLDEIYFYRYARSADEIKQDYLTYQTSVVLGTKSSDPLSDGLVGYWKMDETGWDGSVGEVIDHSGNNNNGTSSCYGTCTEPSTATGKYGNGGSFDGSDDYVDIPDNPSLVPENSDLSVSFWANIANEDQNGTLISKADPYGDFAEYHVSVSDNQDLSVSGQKMVFSFRESESNERRSIVAADVADGQWHHYVAVADKNANKITIYQDGVTLLWESETNTGSWPTPNPSESLKFGTCYNDSYYAQATLDEVRIYNRALSSAEVSQLYNWAPGPVVYYKFDEASETSAFDSSGNNNNGTVLGNTQWKQGKYGNGLWLSDGNYTDSVQYTNPGISGAYTFEFWTKFDKDLTCCEWLSSYIQRDDTHGVRLTNYYETGFSVNHNYSGGSYNVTYNHKDINDSQWHHFAFVYNGTDTGYLYVDGGLADQDSHNPPDWLASGGINYLFQYPANNSSTKDEVKIYNYARTPAQIIEDMNAGHPAPGSPVGSAHGEWSFEEGYENTTHNTGIGGSSLNGTITGATWTNEGKFGKALDFGANNYDRVVTSLISNKTEDFAFSAWVKWNGSNGSNQTIFHNGDVDAGNGWLIVTYPPNNNLYIVCENINTVTSTQALTAGEWQHLLVQKTNEGTWQMFLNANEIPLTDVCNPITPSNISIIGNVKDSGPSYAFNGNMDEVKFYNSALTSDQVKLLYNQGSSSVMGATSTDASNNPSWSSTDEYCPPGQGSTCTGPVAEWKFDENTGSSAYDTSGNNLTGIYGDSDLNPHDLYWNIGKYGSAADFTKTSDYFINVPYNSIFDVTNLTLEAWIYPTTVTGMQNFLCRNPSASGNACEYGLYLNGDEIQFQIYASGSQEYVDTSASNITPNKWHFVSSTFQDSTKNVVIYINGVPQTTTGSITSSLATSTRGFEIGHDNVSRHFNGYLDTSRLFNYARTPAQITWDYNKGAPIALYDFDECSGDTLHDTAPKADSSTTGYNGTITPSSSDNLTVGSCNSGVSTEMWNDGTNGKYSASLGFDGVDDYVDAHNNSVFDFTTTHSFSVSAWVNSQDWHSDDQSNPIVQKYNWGAHDGWMLGIRAANCFGMNLFSRTLMSSDENRSACISANTYISLNNWHHVVGIIDRTSDYIYFYLDDKLAASTNIADWTSADTTDLNLMIGHYGSAISGWPYAAFQGKIDDVRIYNYALTDTQVKTLYNGGAIRFQGP